MPAPTPTRTAAAAPVGLRPGAVPAQRRPRLPAAGSARRLRNPLVLLLPVALLLHAPAFTRGLWNADEGFLATQARMLAHGAALYGGVVDRKPPLVPYLYTAVFEVFGGGSLWPLRCLAVVAHLLTAYLVAVLARDRHGARAGLAAGLLYLVASVGMAPGDTRAAGFEVFMLPATAAAVVCARRGRFGAAGLAVACAGLTKQVGLATLVPVLFLAWRRRDARGAVWALVGTSVPFVVCALLFGPSRFLFWVVTGSAGYLSLGAGVLRALARASGNLAIIVAASLPVCVAAWRGRRWRADADLWLWLGAATAGVLTGFHFFGHYFLQLLPPLVLLGVGGVVRGTLRPRVVLSYAVASACVFTVLTVVWPDECGARAGVVAAAVRRESRPGDRLLVWGMNPAVYWLSDRMPASRFLTAGFLTNFAGGRQPDDVGEDKAVPGAWEEFAADLARNPPEVVVDDSGDASYRPDRIPRMEAFLAAHYRPVAIASGAVVYRRVR